jgi:hypothetical protein
MEFQGKPLFERRVFSQEKLRRARDPGAESEAASLPVTVVGEVFPPLRDGPHETHFSPEHIPKPEQTMDSQTTEGRPYAPFPPQVLLLAILAFVCRSEPWKALLNQPERGLQPDHLKGHAILAQPQVKRDDSRMAL